jgi:hypothetical protein
MEGEGWFVFAEDLNYCFGSGSTLDYKFIV